jgi:hypothetical protein
MEEHVIAEPVSEDQQPRTGSSLLRSGLFLAGDCNAVIARQYAQSKHATAADTRAQLVQPSAYVGRRGEILAAEAPAMYLRPVS